MTRLLLLHLILNGVLFSVTWAWSVNMPRNIRGLHGSCLVIPCSFSYSYSPPTNPDRIVWYQYVSRGYPLVYDDLYPEYVIEKFRGQTSLYSSKELNDCSLLIKNLDLSHHGEKIYTWIDPEHVGWRTYSFYDVTSTILIETSAEKPSIRSFGGSQIGETITVQCSTSHTCPANKPTLILSGIENKEGTSDEFEDDDIGDGKWKITLIRQGILRSANQRFDCIVNHPGGLSASATKEHTGKCAIDTPQITPDSSTEFLEGVETDIVCSVTYMCPKDRPSITWNDGQLYGSTIQETHGNKMEARSTLKFTAKASDHGRVITCKTHFKENVQISEINLKVKRYEGLRMETIGLYVLTPLFICLLLCAVAGVVIYRKRKGSRPVSGV